LASEGTPTTGLQPSHALDALFSGSGRAGFALRLAPLALVALPLLDFLLANPPAERLASLLPAIAVFVAIVLWTVLAPIGALSRRALVAAVLLTLLAAVVLLIDPSHHWLILFFYPAAASGLVASTRQASIAIVSVSIVVAVPAWFLHEPLASRLEHSLECLVVGFASLAVARLVIVNRQLALARAEIARLAAADERLRIARDLHDLLGHGLSVISLKAQLAGRLLPVDPARAAVEVTDIEAVSRRSLGDVRAAVGGYRRLRLEGELEGALIALEAAGVATDLDHQAGILPDEVDEAFAWSVREGATNIVRHAQARKAVIRTRRQERAAVLEIINDDARPRSQTGARSARETRPGSGLAGLAERAVAIGGRIEAAPQPEGGFRLAVIIPVAADPS
jgi:two-component system, NarL family, sensor histidine kinase DesK